MDFPPLDPALMLERLAAYIMSHDGVQFRTFNQIADDFLANHPRR